MLRVGVAHPDDCLSAADAEDAEDLDFQVGDADPEHDAPSLKPKREAKLPHRMPLSQVTSTVLPLPRPAARGAPSTEEAAEALNIEEPLILVGDVNRWSVQAAQARSRLARCGTGEQGCQDHVIRVHVPETGISFYLCSALNPDGWRLFPGQGPTALRDGVMDHVNVCWAAGPAERVLSESGQRYFVIAGNGVAGPVDVRVRLS